MKRMRGFFPVAFIVSVLALCASAPLESADAKVYADRQVIVKLKRGLLKADGEEIRGALRSKIKERFKLIDAELWDISGMTVDEAINKYRGDPRIEYIEPNYIVSAFDVIPNDPFFPLLWGLHNTGQSGGTPDADIDAPEAWGVQTGAQVVIGVIDTGVDYLHPDLAANIWTNPDEVPGNGIDDDGNGYVDDVHGWDFVNNDNDPMDDHSHGTHCSGTIAAIGDNGIGVAGVCWHARIMPLKFLDAGGYGTTANAVLALEYATANGARVTSNSWGGGSYSSALYEAIAAARDAGALFIAAAGNDAADNDLYPHYPSSYDLDNIIAVAATDRNDAMAGFSCYGATSVDLGAPGVDVYSCLPGSNYGFKSGTSMATPHVSGAAGLFWSEHPGEPYTIVKTRMLASIDSLQVLQGKTVSGGRLNLFKILAELDSIPPAAVNDLTVSGPGSGGLALAWTATGDDGASGTASSYDVRYSLSPIDTNNFDSAGQAAGEPRPQPAGSPETMTVTGLNYNSTYYFALKARDEWGNASPLSNEASGATLGPPNIVVSPDSLADSLLTGETSTRQVTISNTGESDLAYGIAIQELMADDTSPAMNQPIMGGQDPTPNVTDPTTEPIEPEAVYGGDYLSFGISTYGEIMPYQYPVGNEHLMVGAFLAGYTVAYRFEGTDHVCYAAYGERLGIEPVSYTESANNALRVAVEVVTRTTDLRLRITQRFTFARNDKYVRIETTLENTSGGQLADVVFKSLADWDMDGSWEGDSWNYDAAHNMVYAWEGKYAAIGGSRPPDYMDIDGWNDYVVRETTVDYPVGPVLSYDGLEVLHFEMGDLAAGGSTQLSTVYAAGDDLADLQRRIERGMLNWLVAEPSSGTVPAGESATVDVTFDATGMFGGDYRADVVIASNDPAHIEVNVPAHLQVTGAPDIAVSDMTLDYGPVFIGGSVADAVQVTNVGTDTLRVSGVSVDNGDFTVDVAPFVLGPAGSRDLAVTFTPATTGMREGTLAILSNDPDEGEVHVALRGVGMEPPVISVTPDSLADSLMTGETSTQQVTISNTGVSDLVWSAWVVQVEGEGSQVYVLRVPVAEGVDPETGEAFKAENVRTAGISASLGDLHGVHILWDMYHGEVSSGNWSTIVSDVTARGATVTQNSQEITAALLEGYDLIWLHDMSAFSPSEIAAVQAWVRSGGALLFETDQSAVAINALLSGLEPGIAYIPTAATNGITTRVYPHETTKDVASVYITNPLAQLAVTAPAGRAVDDVTGAALCAYSRVAGGRIFAISDEIFTDGVIGQADNQLLANEVVDWLTGGVTWLAVAPDSGTISASGSVAVDVTFDATGMYGGDYDANVVIASNDPLHPQVSVPAHLRVTGAPDIAVSDTLVDFGIVWVGHGDSDTLVISNEGTDTLLVSGVKVSSERFGADTTVFALAPREWRLLPVTCNAVATGITEGMLTILSNDPVDDTLLVSLRFEAVPPPEMRISPASLTAGLHTGESLVRMLTIDNDGGDSLTYAVHEGGATSGGRTALKILLIYSDYCIPQGIRDSLAAFPDIALVDVFDAKVATPSLGTLLHYDCVLLTNYIQFKDRWTLGDILADYVDLGGGVIMTHLSFGSSTYPVAGRFQSDGYSPFTSLGGFASSANLGAFDAGHPIMAGVTQAYTHEPQRVTLSTGAVWVASWNNGVPFVAAKGAHVVGVTITFWCGMEYEWGGDLPRLIHNAAFWASGGGDICWAEAAPKSGVVSPFGSTQVAVTFNPRSLCAPAGSFDDTLLVSSNAPAAPSVRVPLHLDVIAAPDVAVGDTLLDFGSVLIGNTAERTVTVANYGAVPLSVSSLAIDNPVFTPNASSFTLAVNEERVIAVAFEPVAPGLIEGTLSIASNDPDEPVVAVALRGQALTPPEIAVSPDSLYASVMHGDSLARVVQIGNGGVADLEWSIYPLDGAEMKSYTLPAVPPRLETQPSPDAGGSTELGEEARAGSGELAATLADLEGVRVLFDYSHGEVSSTYWWSIFIGDLQARGATVEMNRVPITPAILAGCDIYWITDIEASFSESEITALRDWVEAGGGLLFEGDQSAAFYNAILAGLAAGVEYSPVAGTSGVTTDIRPHVMTLDVLSVKLNYNWGHLSSVSYPARLLVNDAAGLANAAYSVAGKGKIVAIADEPFYNDYIVSADNRLLGNQVMDWLAFGANWLRTEPMEGTVQSGLAQTVHAIIEPRGLHGGTYDARLHVASNDPSTPEVTVPVRVSVTGVPALALSDTTLDFGQVLIGATERRDLIVTNAGSDLLVVKRVTVEGAGYSVDGTGFSLPVHGADTVIVSLLPESAGPMPGMLTIYSNDPADTARAVELAGEGLIPPEIVVTPGSLSDSLFTGQSSVHVLTIENPGENPLVFTLIENGPGNRILIVKSGSEVSTVRAALAGFADVSAVDMFDGAAGTPALEYLMGYRCVIVANGAPLSDPVAVGNVLADYVDRGGGVILTVPSFVSGIAMQGRFISGGYSPFTIGTGFMPNATLGSYDAAHPVMAGISSMQSVLYTSTNLIPGADWVAQWSNGVPFVATMGDRVVGANMFIIDTGPTWPGPSAGVIAQLLHNAMEWMSGGNICWMSAEPSAGSIAPHSSAEIAVTFTTGGPVCITGGRHLDTLVVASNVPSRPRVDVPLELFFTSAPDIATIDIMPDFGPVLLGTSIFHAMVVFNTGWDTLVVGSITADNPLFSAVPGAFSLAPLDSQDVFVHFAPADTGLVHGTLTIASNDPDETNVPFALSGRGTSNVALASPLGGEEWRIGDTDTIRWAVSGPAPDSVSVFLSRDGGASYLDTLATGLAGTTRYAWVVTPPETPSARIMIRSYRGLAVSGYDASDSLFALVVVTGVDETDEGPPAVNFLAQNYPNPLNPSTRIDFSLRGPGRVSLRIYDAAGRLVRTLIDEPRNAGRYSEDWDGRDSRGRSVASGVYYYRLVSGSFAATRKMVLLR